uniref:AIMP2 thioredoxin-like domain-containing protein n=1 Tax=Arion vulgaris TaxID=1028688 RepID=A0A0B6Z311_9EUPU
MGNVISRCAQDVRNAWARCSKKHAEEETMLSTCDSEPLDKCHEQIMNQSLSGVDSTSRTGSPTSVHRLEERIEPTSNTLLLAAPAPVVCSPHRHTRGRQTVMSSNSNGDLKRLNTSVDQASQTNTDAGDGTDAGREELDHCAFSRAYIVKTYSIQNATPSPSPGAHTKFPTTNHSARSSQTFSDGSSLSISPIDSLEQRQEDVLKKLERLQESVSKLAERYSVSGSPTDIPTPTLSATTSSTTSSQITVRNTQTQPSQSSLLGRRNGVLDLVICADPASIPLSLIVLCENLSNQHKVLKSTFVHSSVSAESVSDKFRSLLTSNNGIKRDNCDLAINLIWRKVPNGPQLVVDPTKQTTIEGEANIARYLTRLLNPSHEEDDIVTATLIDEILDLAQLQLLDGKTKEKTAAVRTLNSMLGKSDWLIGSEPSVADVVCWSALHQTNQASSSPANVKKWLNLCSQHKLFKSVSGLLS